jgi:hypothetical protein
MTPTRDGWSVHVVKDKSIPTWIICHKQHGVNLDIEAFQVAGFEQGGVPFYSAQVEHTFTSSFDLAAPYLTGFLKWDGCFNFQFPAHEVAMLHTCGRRALEDIGELLTAIYDLGAEHNPHWWDPHRAD